MTVRETCETLQELQSRRGAVMKAQFAVNNQAGAFVRRALGWSPDLPEKERNAIARAAGKLVKAVADGSDQAALAELDDCPEGVAGSVYPFCVACRAASGPFEEMRKLTEKGMVALAKTLPVWSFVSDVRGFGALGLAIIVGEAGDLSGYANPAKLWKRLGLAVFGGKSQRKCRDKADAAMQGYSPRRRSAMWTLGDSLIKGNADGVYRTTYLERKAYENARCEAMTKMHAHRRAQRVMEKLLLKNLWRAWHHEEAS